LEAHQTAAAESAAEAESQAASHSAPRPTASPAPTAKSYATPAAATTRAPTASRPTGTGGAPATGSATSPSAKKVGAAAAVPKAGPSTANVPSVDKPAAEPAPTPNPAAAARKKQMILIGAGALVVALLGVFAWSKMRPIDAPRLNSEPHVIGSFTATSAFERLPFDKKWQYYELMDDKEPALKAAYAAGKMTDDEFRKALQAAWYGKHLTRMKKYFEKPPGRERTAYLDKLVQKKYEDDNKDKKGSGKGAGKAESHGKSESHGKPDSHGKSESHVKSDSHSPLTAEEIKRDDTDQEVDISAWPPDVRAKWEEYKKEYKARKDVYKQAREDEKAKKNAPVTKPVAVPG
jgi:hypothetical protein